MFELYPMRSNLEVEHHIEMLRYDHHDGTRSDQLSLDTSIHPISFVEELKQSFHLMAGSKLNALLAFAPIAFLGSQSGKLGEFQCFCFAGLALIPCAERLSYVTERLSEHTNETIGALLNATFGNMPELLISNAALRNGFYRVVQLTLLGSILTNLLLVFGLSCLVGGLQWQTQTLRITSGNVSIGMLLVATMGIVLPAVLKLANQSKSSHRSDSAFDGEEITKSDIAFSRFNSLAMVIGYFCYLIFQLGSHKDEFDYDGDEYAKYGGSHHVVRCPSQHRATTKKDPMRRNRFCKRFCLCMKYCPDVKLGEHNYEQINSSDIEEVERIVEIQNSPQAPKTVRRNNIHIPQSLEANEKLIQIMEERSDHENNNNDGDNVNDSSIRKISCKLSDVEDFSVDTEIENETIMSIRCGLFWLAIVTSAISIISGIIVDTIDGFAAKSKMSEVFTSVIIIPYFSNIAEQVSALIFAYRNKMDLCIGVTVGSGIQIALLIMPLSCICSWIMGRSMTLYFRAYETICLLLGVICVAAVLQGGTTNWLVGVYLVAIYAMIAAGFYWHENESISTNEELERWR